MNTLTDAHHSADNGSRSCDLQSWCLVLTYFAYNI